MTTSLVVRTESEPPILSKRPLDFETWKKDGSRRFHSLQTTAKALETDRWAIGDWLIEGEEEFGKKAYEEAEQITGWERGTLYNVVWVVRRFRTLSLRSETGLKWSHFKELARIEDEQAREVLLRQFNDGFQHSVLDVRSSVDSFLRKLSEKKDSEKVKPKKSFVYLQVSLKPNDRDLVKLLAKAERKKPELFLRDIVLEYFDRNKKDVAKIQGTKNPTSSKSR